ncbi:MULTISPECIES: hypothetical protein [unclassified Paenibacillus]|uniref:hypothetical protein n=1 Tax=unclassified Paenibacillus TaxID=185978 RepID=UPI001AE4E408|nr:MULTISPECIES: hypothetical protein [unclassified Paenibacillus]MBP1154672.1 hypothetical protein [Paenibacillus sp. PvP091]MBP1169944.1 hypothetical protein [Paenibacillus sp. PvR098]MBP2440972.1 hypothetical protein [Paenibacillus sp. PvP052]
MHNSKDHELQSVDERELEALEDELRRTMSTYLTRAPKQAETRNLIQSLQSEFAALQQIEPALEMVQPLPLERPSFLRQCWIQLQLFGKAFWVISAAIIIMMTLVSPTPGTLLWGFRDVYSLILPLFLLCAAVYSYKSWNAEMRMVESVTPFPPALLLLIRLLLITAMIVLFGLLSTCSLVWIHYDFSIGTFLLGWMSGVLFVGGILAYIAYHWGIRYGFAAAGASWALLQITGGILGRFLYERLELMYWLQAVVLLAGLLLFFRAFLAGWGNGSAKYTG